MNLQWPLKQQWKYLGWQPLENVKADMLLLSEQAAGAVDAKQELSFSSAWHGFYIQINSKTWNYTTDISSRTKLILRKIWQTISAV